MAEKIDAQNVTTQPAAGFNMGAFVEKARLKSTLKCTRKAQYDPTSMSAEDKIVVCGEFNKVSHEMTLRTFAKNHGMNHMTLHRWLRRLKQCEERESNAFLPHGRPPVMDKESLLLLREELISRRVSLNCPDKHKTRELVDDCVRAVKRQKGENDDIVVKMCDRTFFSIREQLNIVERTANPKTAARIEAEGDPRNAFSMYCMARAFCGVKHKDKDVKSAHLIFNWDATQFKVSQDGPIQVCVVNDGEDDSASDIPATKPSAGDTDIFVKLYHFHNAAGYPAPPVYVFADDTMEKDDFVWRQVKLAGNTGINKIIIYKLF